MLQLNISTASRDLIMATVRGSEAARQDATTAGTQEERARSFSRWNQFLERIEYHQDPFLENLEHWQRVTLMSCFAHSTRTADYSSRSHDTLASSKVQGAEDQVAQTFRERGQPDPRLDSDSLHSLLLLRQYQGYQRHDKPPQQQCPS